MHIGLIGGIGPSATIAYYTAILRRFRAADLPLELTIVHADVGRLIANATADKPMAQAEIFARHIQQLAGAGCDVAVITALTGHFCFAETEGLSTLPLVSAIAPIDRYCAEQGLGTIGLLGSAPVMSSSLFGQLRHTHCVMPGQELNDVATAYLEMASTGVCSEAARQMFFAAGSKMVTEQGADAVLLAGTDLGLAFGGQEPGFPVIDAADIHVDALVALAEGRT